MRFICDVCPTTAAEGQAVIIGHYDKWIRHLLSPQHQTEQNLAMRRTTYWPESHWIALIKNLPEYDGTTETAELYLDVMLSLSECGFIEAIYYGNKTDSVCVAIQLYYDAIKVPQHLTGPDKTTYEIKLAPRFGVNSANGLSDSKITKRRFRGNSTSSTLSEASAKSVRDMATSPIKIESPSLLCEESATPLHEKNEGFKTQEIDIKKNRIKYDRNDLLQFCGEKSIPLRFSEILGFPTHLIVEEAKTIDTLEMEQLRNVKWIVDESGGSRNAGYQKRSNGFNNTGTGNQKDKGFNNERANDTHSAGYQRANGFNNGDYQRANAAGYQRQSGFNSNGLPCTGNRLPFTGNRLPFTGNRLPFNGNGLPFNGNGLPFNGNGLPLARGERVQNGWKNNNSSLNNNGSSKPNAIEEEEEW